MANIFISHSSEDNQATKEIFDDLSTISKSIFLDFDTTGHGLKGGDDWEKTLYKRVKKARIMIVALSPNWLNSKWCYKEYCMARVLRKKIIPVVIEEDKRISSWDGKDIQHYDTTRDSEALEKLKKRIEELTFHDVTKLYDTKKIESPYPGLRSFNKEEAGIFYGRNDATLEVIDILNALADSGEQKFLNIVGASGVGKSSFLKAGVLPLLELLHRENWYVLPTFRAKQEILLNLAKALSIFDYKAGEVLDAIKGEGYRAFFDGLELALFESQNEPNQKILLPIDQAEEILNSESQEEREQFFKIVQYLVEKKANFFIVWTLRSDQLNVYQAQKALEFLRDKERVYILNPIASKELHNIIQEPAFVNDVMVKDDVVEAIKEDTKTTTSLPLLAYLLQILYKNITLQQQKSITLDNYKALAKDGKNPIENIINQEADEIYSTHKNKKEIEELFVNHLVKINQDESFSKRSEMLNHIPSTLHALVDRFVQKRLLIKDTDKEGQVTVEIVHEAMLNSWDTLQEWLNTQKEFLLLKAQLDFSMRGWGGLEKKEMPLLTGLQLQKAKEYKDRLKDKEELEYVQRSIKRDEALKRRKFLAVSGSFVAISALGGVSFWKWGEASEKSIALGKQKLVLQEEVDRAKHNVGLAFFEKAKSALIEKSMHYVNYFAYKALTLYTKDNNIHEITTSMINNNNYTKCVNILDKHTDSITCLIYSSCNKYIISGSKDKSIKIWDLLTGKCIRTLLGHKNGISSITLTKDGKNIFSASLDKTIKIWHTETGKLLYTYNKHQNNIRYLVCSPNEQYILSSEQKDYFNSSLHIWERDSGKLIKKIDTNIIIKIIFFNNGKQMLSISEDYSGIDIWDTKDWKIIRTLSFNSIRNNITDIFYRENKKYLYIGTSYHFEDGGLRPSKFENTIKVFNLENSEFVNIDILYKYDITSINYIPKNNYIVSSSGDKTIRIWNSITGKLIEKLNDNVMYHNYSSPIDYPTIYHIDNQTIISTVNNKIKIWDMKNKDRVTTLVGHYYCVQDIAFSPNEKTLVSCADDGTIKTWDIQSGKLLNTIGDVYDDNGTIFEVNYSFDGKKIVSIGEDNIIKIWDSKSGKLLNSLKENAYIKDFRNFPSKRIIFAPNGNIISCFRNKIIKIYDSHTFKLLNIFSGHNSIINCLEISSNGEELISASKDGIIKIWNIKNTNIVKTFLGHNASINCLTISSDNKYIILGSTDGIIKVWDRKKGKLINTLKGHTQAIRNIVYSNKDRYIISASNDMTIKIWDLATSNLLHTLTNHKHNITGLVYLEKSKKLISSSQDVTIQIRNLSEIIKVNNFKYQKKKIKELEQEHQIKLDGINLLPTKIPYTKPLWSKHHPFHWIDDAENGDAEAMYQLGLIYDRDNENQKALEWYKKASTQGHKEAEEQLVFLEGWIKKNNKKNKRIEQIC